MHDVGRRSSAPGPWRSAARPLGAVGQDVRPGRRGRSATVRHLRPTGKAAAPRPSRPLALEGGDQAGRPPVGSGPRRAWCSAQGLRRRPSHGRAGEQAAAGTGPVTRTVRAGVAPAAAGSDDRRPDRARFELPRADPPAQRPRADRRRRTAGSSAEHPGRRSVAARPRCRGRGRAARPHRRASGRPPGPRPSRARTRLVTMSADEQVDRDHAQADPQRAVGRGERDRGARSRRPGR